MRALLVDWVPLAAVLFVYDLLRGYADELQSAYVWPQLRVDEWLFFGTVPTVWLQERLWSGTVDWFDYVNWVVYLTHFVATLTVAACLWLFRRPLFRPYAAMVALLAAAGFATYAAFPAVRRGWPAIAATSARSTASCGGSRSTPSSTSSARSGSPGRGTRTTSPRCRRSTPRTRS